jgi:hypothetical protein
VLVAVASLAFAGTVALGGPPPPPALPLERVRVARGRVLGPAVVSVPVRTLMRLIRLCLALPAIGMTPPSRSDTPALPTVGRPRDAPVRRATQAPRAASSRRSASLFIPRARAALAAPL